MHSAHHAKCRCSRSSVICLGSARTQSQIVWMNFIRITDSLQYASIPFESHGRHLCRSLCTNNAEKLSWRSLVVRVPDKNQLRITRSKKTFQPPSDSRWHAYHLKTARNPSNAVGGARMLYNKSNNCRMAKPNTVCQINLHLIAQQTIR